MELDFKHDKCFWVMPNESESGEFEMVELRFNRTFNKEFFYAVLIPQNCRIEIHCLRKILDKSRTYFLLTGGGVQERSVCLKESLDENVSIVYWSCPCFFIWTAGVILVGRIIFLDGFFGFSNPRLFIPSI